MTNRLTIRNWFPFQSSDVKRFLVIFYIIALAGFLIPFTFDFFLVLAKWALLLNLFLILWFHGGGFDYKTIITFIVIFILGYIIETASVNTGLIFGNYRYGNALGPKLFKTPLLIGFNWFMLSYCFASVAESFRMTVLLKIITCSAGMLVYDIIMEQSASLLDMWYWKNDSIPAQNYITWFLVALVIQTLLAVFRIKFKNPVAKTILLCQFAFFLLLVIFKRIIL
jgi:uncharacterized membrane protein